MSKNTCFAIMPFGPPFDRYFKNIFVPAIEDAGLRAIRADSIFMPSAIMPDIWKFLSEAQVLVADLTGRNPNVFYELGLAHALQKPVILVASNLDDVPFDLRGLRVLGYDKENEDWGAELRRAIAASLRETLSDPARAIPSTFLERRISEPQKVDDPLQAVLRQLTEEVRAMRRQTDSHDSGRKRIINSEGEELEQFTRTVIKLGVFDEFPEVYDELKFRIVIWLTRGQTTVPETLSEQFPKTRKPIKTRCFIKFQIWWTACTVPGPVRSGTLKNARCLPFVQGILRANPLTINPPRRRRGDRSGPITAPRDESYLGDKRE